MSGRFAPGTFTPAPGAGAPARMLLTHARTEAMLTLRNGEQVLLTLLIPLALLIGLTYVTVVDLPEPRVDSLVPRVFALAVMSTAFTGQAIALGFDRRYGVLKRLAATALPRWLLVAGRVVGCLAVVALQLVVLGVTGALLGWTPTVGALVWTVVLVVLGTLVFGALGVLLGGSLKAEVVLALANVIWLVLLLAGGVVLTVDALPAGMAEVVRLLPSAALTEGLTDALVRGTAPALSTVVTLLGWGAAAGLLATRTTKLV
ncbi:ABC transporter permease [Actinokineospora diospyrosa]|uniref:ABC-2 type transport system permease protein n=1 Tax=Actinokineospora diospyrosa TaxID=103728 RepID=A0ABT1I7N7_9PSEU|nr:ABC transporter permease [Actinokineospora diospyrosa]MCP2268411.1 ABC-2 type transport system permease protein [Actinokineospora diospyrosa]